MFEKSCVNEIRIVHREENSDEPQGRKQKDSHFLVGTHAKRRTWVFATLPQNFCVFAVHYTTADSVLRTDTTSLIGFDSMFRSNHGSFAGIFRTTNNRIWNMFAIAGMAENARTRTRKKRLDGNSGEQKREQPSHNPWCDKREKQGGLCLYTMENTPTRPARALWWTAGQGARKTIPSDSKTSDSKTNFRFKNRKRTRSL